MLIRKQVDLPPFSANHGSMEDTNIKKKSENCLYRNPERTPIQICLSGQQITIDCCLRFNRRAIKTGPSGPDGLTYAQLIQTGISRYWSGQHLINTPELPGTVSVSVMFQSPDTRRSCLIRVRPLFFMPAHVVSPFYRRLWGFFKTGQFESIGLNWSPENPGVMVLPPFENQEILQRVAAHEFGHLLGLGDAYGAFYRFYANAPNTGHYIMNSRGTVQPQEVQMVLKAHKTRRMQYFPRSFQISAIRRGIKRDLLYQVHALAGRCKKLLRTLKHSNR